MAWHDKTRQGQKRQEKKEIKTRTDPLAGKLTNFQQHLMNFFSFLRANDMAKAKANAKAKAKAKAKDKVKVGARARVKGKEKAKATATAKTKANTKTKIKTMI